MERPFPPEHLADQLRHPEGFEPASDVWEWVQATFLDRESPLFNPEHAHLQAATVGVLWTNVANTRHMRSIAGMAEVPQSKGGKWTKARADQQLTEWFGTANLDFLITLDAPYCGRIDDATFCALVEHELYHCAHRRDRYGAPKFHKDGRPVFGIRGHDVEEFVGVVRRYGVGAATGGVGELVEAANGTPEVAGADIVAACGTCEARG